MSEEEKRKLKITQEVYKFAKKYYNSKGFEQRLQRHSDQLDETYRYSEYDPENAYTYFVEKTPLRLYHFDLSSAENSGEYDPITKTIQLGNKLEKHWYDPRTWGNNFVGGQQGMTAHEIGHAIDHSIQLVGGGNYIMENLYSNTYPIFRQSKAYQKARRKLDYDEKSQRKFDLIPMWFYEGAHDAMPTESYADLFQLRELLYRLGIYDSTKENNKAEQKHLDELRKKDNRKYRIFDNFTDEQVLWMLNNVAQVYPQSKTSEQKVYYAKHGLKTRYYINKKSGSN